MYTPCSPGITEQRAAYRVKLKDFEGPLDLLLFLIKKNEINVYDIPIAYITEQYLAYLRYAATLDLEDLSEFQVMAATLVYIKSRMLLPVEMELDEDIEDPRQGLVDKLIEYQKFKKLAELMEEKEREHEWFIERKKELRVLPFTGQDLWQHVDIGDLLKTFSSLMANLSDERIIDLYEEVSVNEKITLMTELLEWQRECTFADLVVRKGSLMDVVCAFLAILEAVKIRLVVIVQNRIFGDILIRKSHPVQEQTVPGVLIGTRDCPD
ncbi:MAG: segregation/condensation protein A [Treponema sp.]|jgi:segregation and condensation protein A|nr:segregation/condensation protein A [Treponema sp.]